MRELPILFSATMVRAILEGRKTVTRRVVKPLKGGFVCVGAKAAWDGCSRADYFAVHASPAAPQKQGNRWVITRPGDRLYVREAFTLEHCVEGEDPPFADRRPIKGRDVDDVDGVTPLWVQPHYRATDPAPDLSCDRPGCAQCRNHDMGPHWVPSIHMPKWAARIWLEVTAVRVERLQDITTEQVIAEGITSQLREHDAVVDLRQQFEVLWDGLAKPGARWADNPWVWVVEFCRIEGGAA